MEKGMAVGIAVGIAFVTFFASKPTPERHFADPFPALVLELCAFLFSSVPTNAFWFPSKTLYGSNHVKIFTYLTISLL